MSTARSSSRWSFVDGRRSARSRQTVDGCQSVDLATDFRLSTNDFRPEDRRTASRRNWSTARRSRPFFSMTYSSSSLGRGTRGVSTKPREVQPPGHTTHSCSSAAFASRKSWALKTRKVWTWAGHPRTVGNTNDTKLTNVLVRAFIDKFYRMLTRIHIRGMSCNHCVQAVYTSLTPVQGVTGLEIGIGWAGVEHDGRVTVERLREAIGVAGYEVEGGTTETRRRSLPVLSTGSESL